MKIFFKYFHSFSNLFYLNFHMTDIKSVHKCNQFFRWKSLEKCLHTFSVDEQMKNFSPLYSRSNSRNTVLQLEVLEIHNFHMAIKLSVRGIKLLERTLKRRNIKLLLCNVGKSLLKPCDEVRTLRWKQFSSNINKNFSHADTQASSQHNAHWIFLHLHLRKQIGDYNEVRFMIDEKNYLQTSINSFSDFFF